MQVELETASDMASGRQGKTLVVGLGKTGLSCARYLRSQGVLAAVTDSRPRPPGLDDLRERMPELAVFVGGFDPEVFAAATQLVVSPGVPVSEPLIQQAIARGVPVIGDVELFARAARAPICAITGSNGKSTVTTLLGLMARLAGRRVAVGGNLGEPVLDLLDPAADLYAIELSSFQLETTPGLRADVAVVLNVSADHLDRYPDLDAYAETKAAIYRGARVAVVNRDDPRVLAMRRESEREIGFTLGEPGPDDLGLMPHAASAGDSETPWIFHGQDPLMPASEVAIPGRHNLANALAALALASACGIPAGPACEALRTFPGLPHRSELVAERDGVRWYDDSKGTNPGATVAALAGLIPEEGDGKVVLIAGGAGKGADFQPLLDPVRRAARAVVLIGRDAPAIERVLAGAVPLVHAVDMADAVRRAAELARSGDSVLLSPACASLDMFDNYEHRGRVFADTVRRLLS
ncbi:UDP-N-acetylmuramoyl-L-alanine--D-glutamate ligase [Imhoffiella purpurea]|uniref:UDP-N-acetylmuramoylalanine--D-glutamate ligase n=1 Tax=Imhoffiella purpurea TaxID=1249627 RepID=W9V7T7_9GAMM|nr:UDP-N-acetylmuramoyl-L-alanine--D-glutamate ligase [Imhoffiella purpurea]EXJ15489.1 UDP-N-acetylmuramoylalanine--D-glutamate ligase [Imhoffiella purpurea]